MFTLRVIWRCSVLLGLRRRGRCGVGLSGEDGDDAPRAWSTRTQHTRRTRGACTTRGRMWRSAAESSPSVPVRARPLSLTRLLRPTALARETLRVARVATLYSSGEGGARRAGQQSASQTVRQSEPLVRASTAASEPRQPWCCCVSRCVAIGRAVVARTPAAVSPPRRRSSSASQTSRPLVG